MKLLSVLAAFHIPSQGSRPNVSHLNITPKLTIQWAVSCNKSRLAVFQACPPPAKGAPVVRGLVVIIAVNAILVSGCVDLTPPWKQARATGDGGTAGASGTDAGVTAVDGESDGTGVAVDGTGETGGGWSGDAAAEISGDGSSDGMVDVPGAGGEAGSDPVADAAIDGNDDVAVGGAGGAGGYGDVGRSAGGSGGTEPDAVGTETGGGGGMTGTGGRWETGGNPSSGGAMGGGGIAATGGVWATGGNPATGGATGTGGLSATGGTSATGGVAATGGMTAMGGMVATGGNPSTGGATGTGGSSSVPCSGVLYSGICWYLASSGESCTQACTAHGGPSSLVTSHVGTAAQGGSLTECATILSRLGVAGTVQNVTSTSGVGCSKNIGTLGPGPGLYWCTTPDFSTNASLTGVQPACGCLQ